MNLNLASEIERYTKNTIFSDLEKGDPGRDVPHTKAIVYYIKEIVKSLPENTDLDTVVVVIAAYAHDWGYAPFFREGEPLEFDEYMEAKKKHMEVGAKMTRSLLEKPIYDSLSKEQKERIAHLVRVHDSLDLIKDFDELVLQEADTLAGLDTDFIKPTFDPEGNKKYLNSVLTKRLPLFTTEYSKNRFVEVLDKRKNYYAQGLWRH